MCRNLYETECEFNVQLFFNKIYVYIYIQKNIYILYTVYQNFFTIFYN